MIKGCSLLKLMNGNWNYEYIVGQKLKLTIMASFRKLIPHVGRLGALPLRSSTAAVAAPVRSMAGVAAQNPHLSELPADYLYHLGLSDDRSGELEVRWLPMLIPALNILTH